MLCCMKYWQKRVQSEPSENNFSLEFHYNRGPSGKPLRPLQEAPDSIRLQIEFRESLKQVNKLFPEVLSVEQ